MNDSFSLVVGTLQSFDSLCVDTSLLAYFNWLMFRFLFFIIQEGCVSLTSVLSVFEVVLW